MNFSALRIYLGDTIVGTLFKYGSIIRLQVEHAYADDIARPLLSLSMRAINPIQEAALLRNPLQSLFNSPDGERLPTFFQNLLPEGILRKQIAFERHCDENDFFELLAACGNDLPGNVRAVPAELSRELMAKLVTQHQDALEMSVIAQPLDDGVSISGMQPKLALVEQGGRFVAGRRFEGGHIIGKLPTASFPQLPEVEYLSLHLAHAAGVTVCEASLEPLTAIISEHVHQVNQDANFLAVKRFDRDQPGRLHVEDFAQILNVDPENKYTGGTYADIARVMLQFDGLGESAVHELLRRITVSELIGNYDFHLKNIGVRHLSAGQVELSPTYDIVAYSAYLQGKGHALAFTPTGGRRQTLSPALLRQFSNDIGLAEAPLRKVVADVCKKAYARWPQMIAASQLLPEQKRRLTQHFLNHKLIAGLQRRS